MNLLTLPLGLLDDSSFGVASIWNEASKFNKVIISILLVLVLLQVYTAIERFIMYSQSNAASEKFLKLFMDTLRRGDFEAAKRAATTHNKSHVALVLKHGLDIFQYEKQ